MQAKRTGGFAASGPLTISPEASERRGNDSSHGRASETVAPRKNARRVTPCDHGDEVFMRKSGRLNSICISDEFDAQWLHFICWRRQRLDDSGLSSLTIRSWRYECAARCPIIV